MNTSETEILHDIPESDGYGRFVSYHCPGCGFKHTIPVSRGDMNPNSPVWEFNGSFTKPTLHPSVLSFNGGYRDSKGVEHPRVTTCHHFVRDGRIEYCGDSPHHLSGQTVDMVPYSTKMRWESEGEDQ